MCDHPIYHMDYIITILFGKLLAWTRQLSLNESTFLIFHVHVKLAVKAFMSMCRLFYSGIIPKNKICLPLVVRNIREKIDKAISSALTLAKLRVVSVALANL